MQTFELYGIAWLVYLVLGILLLALIGYKIRAFSWRVKFGILSFLAVGSLTPDLVSNAQTYAPLMITALLRAEVEGASAIISGLIKLVIVWGIVFSSALGIRHFWQARKQQKENN